MGLLDPSEDDKQYEKKPRFRQDAIGYVIMFAGGLAALAYVLFFS